MSRHRKPDYTDFYLMILIIISCIGIVVKFFIEVHKHNLWKECLISVSLFSLINYITYLSLNSNIISAGCFIAVLLITFIIFCIYWAKQFGYIP